MSPFSLTATGHFAHNGAPFYPVGVNYWPGSTGVEMWARFTPDEIRRDLDLLASLGLNTVRFFLRWQDFEPDAGRYAPGPLADLRRLLTWIRERRLLAHPSLFVGFMSGGVFWPEWKGGRNLFSDPAIVDRAEAFAHESSRVLAEFSDIVLAVDQGNELCCLAESSEAPPAAVADWSRRISRAIKTAFPGVLVISGNEQNQVVNDTGWRLNDQPGTDLLSMHGYPVPNWHPVAFDGMTDPLCASLLPLYTRIARAHAPVMLQEFGTIVTFGAVQQSAYLRRMLPAALDAGANGFLWWCFRDITASVHPYTKNAFESTLGLVDADGRIKPGLEYFLEFVRGLNTPRPAAPPAPADAATPAVAVQPAPVSLYFPRFYYPRDQPNNPGNDPRVLSRRLILANHLLSLVGRRVTITRGDLPLPDPTVLPVLIVAGAYLSSPEVAAIAAWVGAGGRLLWTGVDPVNWDAAVIRLTGASPVDYRGTRASIVRHDGTDWSFSSFPRAMRTEVVPGGAVVLAHDQDGLPIAGVHRVGTGRVVWCLPHLEDEPARVAAIPAERDRWSDWYRLLLDAVS